MEGGGKDDVECISFSMVLVLVLVLMYYNTTRLLQTQRTCLPPVSTATKTLQ